MHKKSTQLQNILKKKKIEFNKFTASFQMIFHLILCCVNNASVCVSRHLKIYINNFHTMNIKIVYFTIYLHYCNLTSVGRNT